MKACIEKALRGWDRFFFAPQPWLPLAAFRIVFGINLFAMDVLRAKDWRFYFTDEGIVPADQAIEILPDFLRPPFAWYPGTAGMALAMNLALLVAVALLTLGIRSRLAAIVALILHLGLLQRNLAIAYGADIVSTFFLFGLCFCESDRVLSVRNWLARGKPMKSSPSSELFTSVGVRLVQLQLCIIYGYTGLEKFKGVTWWQGTAVWSVLGNRQIMLFDTSWLKNVPLAIAFMTFSTMLWEAYFPVLIWTKPLRKWILAFGLILHAMIALTVGLVFFSGAMVATYFLFLDEAWLRARLSRFFSSRQLDSRAV